MKFGKLKQKKKKKNAVKIRHGELEFRLLWHTMELAKKSNKNPLITHKFECECVRAWEMTWNFAHKYLAHTTSNALITTIDTKVTLNSYQQHSMHSEFSQFPLRVFHWHYFKCNNIYIYIYYIHTLQTHTHLYIQREYVVFIFEKKREDSEYENAIEERMFVRKFCIETMAMGFPSNVHILRTLF